MDNSIVDLLYEAAIIPELWPKACASLAEEVNAATATIFSFDSSGGSRFVCSPNIKEGIEKFVADPRIAENIRPARALRQFPAMFVREIEFLSEEELQSDFVLNDHIRPAGMYWSAGCIFQEPSGHTIMVDLLRREGMDHYSESEIARLNAIKPDLSRSILMASKLAFTTARSITNSMSLLQLPSVVLRDSGQVLAANIEFEGLAPRLNIGARDRLIIGHSSASTLVYEALRQLSSAATASVQSIPIPAKEGLPPLVLHIIPVRRAARDIFNTALALLVVTEVGVTGPPETRILYGLFDLTPAEARVSRLFAMAKSLKEIAAELGVGVETIRTHTKNIMLKTGTRRQADLMGLLLGLSMPTR